MNMQDFSCYVSPVQQNILKTNVLQIYIYIATGCFSREYLYLYIYTHSRSMCPSMFLFYVPYLYLHHSMYSSQFNLRKKYRRSSVLLYMFIYVSYLYLSFLSMFHIYIYTADLQLSSTSFPPGSTGWSASAPAPAVPPSAAAPSWCSSAIGRCPRGRPSC